MTERKEVVGSFAAGLERFMARRRYTMSALAKDTGMSTANVHLLAHGRTLPSLDKVASLIEAGMTAEEVFGKELADRLARNARVVEAANEAPRREEPYEIVESGLAAILERLRSSRNA